MNNTAWHNQDICRHILATNFPPLQDSVHFPPLRECILRAAKGRTVLDVGCCKAELAKTFPELDYTGADLEHIIEGVSKMLQPSLKYIYFNADNDDYSFMSNYDIIVMNSFLSETTNPLIVLDQVLQYASKYVVLHRQDIDKAETHLVAYNTYGGLRATNSIINRQNFVDILENRGWAVDFEINSFENDEPDKKTLLLMRGLSV
jgi:2-polyprenyl-3-methyl-5-hydroxy-6-metoxy-1,4-benzoquinol methylase